MGTFSKTIKRALREYLTVAYERELHRELKKLDVSFDEWRCGKISSGELSHRVHQYDRGPSRELFRKYNAGMDELNVAYAIVVEILEEDEVPSELLEALERTIEILRQMNARGELREPES